MLIAHLTSVHARFDTRIFHKMCTSLATSGHELSLVVADGKSDELVDGVQIYDVGASVGRRNRILTAPTRVLAKALELNADIYHLHDPELLPIGLKLKRSGKRVVFDSHEDVPRQMLSKPYLNQPMRFAIAQGLRGYEAWVCRQLDGVIAATPFIRDKFLKINSNCVDINNFPILGELLTGSGWDVKQSEVCYVGGIAQIRGIVEIVEAMEHVRSSALLNLAGSFGDASLGCRLQKKPGWQRVNPLGHLDRPGVRDVFSRSIAGLVTLHPVINYIDALPVKMFEYMSSGRPIIASKLEAIEEILTDGKTAILARPGDPHDLAQAISKALADSRRAELIGAEAKRVGRQFSWGNRVKGIMSRFNELR